MRFSENFGVLDPADREKLKLDGKKLLRLKDDRYRLDTRSPSEEYCWECGCIGDRSEFVITNMCPNRDCPNPDNWND